VDEYNSIAWRSITIPLVGNCKISVAFSVIKRRARRISTSVHQCRQFVENAIPSKFDENATKENFKCLMVCLLIALNRALHAVVHIKQV
jgi:hypothetical protein